MEQQNCQYSDLFIEHFPFWDKLTESQKEQLCKGSEIRKYKKGQIVHSEGDKCLGVLFIKTGQLRAYMLSDEGKEITLYRLFSGDTCVLAASCVLEAITFDVFIDAQESTEVLMINPVVFRELANENIYVEAYSYKQTALRFSDVMWAMQQILFMGVDKRVAIFLVEEMSKQNSSDIKITHEQLAKYIGTAREVVSRMLKYFESENIIELHRGGIKIIDKKALYSMI